MLLAFVLVLSVASFTFAAIRDLSTFRFRFAQTLSSTDNVWMDNVKITTTDAVDPTNLMGSGGSVGATTAPQGTKDAYLATAEMSYGYAIAYGDYTKLESKYVECK